MKRIYQRCSRQIHLNVTNICEISIEHGNYKNEASDNTGSSTIKVSRIHLKEKRFTCDHCQKTFTNKSNIFIHKRTHTGDNSCDLCNKTFADSSFLMRHKRIHTEERPYHCGIFSKSFSRSTALTIHKRMHRGRTISVWLMSYKIMT